MGLSRDDIFLLELRRVLSLLGNQGISALAE